uniref:Uncharacterized protein n=1 Tax=Wuchereria bancrofti TaxID=6293 RepID=A0A1I8EVW5_WUCBA
MPLQRAVADSNNGTTIITVDHYDNRIASSAPSTISLYNISLYDLSHERSAVAMTQNIRFIYKSKIIYVAYLVEDHL